jgi:hypothetical protein
MNITSNIVVICINIQGEEHHCQEEQGIIPTNQKPANRNARYNGNSGERGRNVPDVNIKCVHGVRSADSYLGTVVAVAPIGRSQICA